MDVSLSYLLITKSCLQPATLPVVMRGRLEFEDISSPGTASAAYSSLPESTRVRTASVRAEGEQRRGNTVRAELAPFIHTIPDFIF